MHRSKISVPLWCLLFVAAGIVRPFLDEHVYSISVPAKRLALRRIVPLFLGEEVFLS